jgi:hypothetical protein
MRRLLLIGLLAIAPQGCAWLTKHTICKITPCWH